PLSFEPNQGQTSSQVQFVAHTADATVFVLPTKVTLSANVAVPSTSQTTLGTFFTQGATITSSKPTTTMQQVAFTMNLPGANPNAPPGTVDPLPGKANYVLGSLPSSWLVGIPTFGAVEY